MISLNFNKNQNKDYDKLLKFLTLVLVVLATFLGGYIWNKRIADTQQASILENSLTTRFNGDITEKTASQLRLIKLTSEDSLFPILSENGKNVLYYVPSSGELRSVSVDGSNSPQVISNTPTSANHVSWSGDRKKLFITVGKNSTFLNLETGASKKFSTGLISPALSPFEDKLAYLSFDEDENKGNIRVSDSQISSYKNLMQTRVSDWTINWLGSTELYLTKRSGQDRRTHDVFILNTETAGLQNVLGIKKDLEFKWSKGGNKVLYSYYNIYDEVNNLYYQNMNQRIETKIDFETTASKCAWGIDDKTIYCAKTGQFGGDTFYKINIETGESENIYTPSVDIDVEGLMLTPTEDYLIFKNLNNNRLYSLEI
ncbi:MAG: hypothetical protein COV29_04505 [Candidatus Yanofskybacteria bacterium CG10_big_fil_rev_8_21_14_0_10_36_16]|uniref:Dipeptidylpeptidase IV N-terminal domain-containing protein n=1 Tax=Candidatus Yanofskybacteria bacterium CG10_big_fil_rev_8_21_14_0_10_36_16 TaxID=1975096 RepID=A0A2J0Q6H5_9BACT|nr:MAG: hypothetical protein COV29_04505 [Candidatus Yanofskybacteria bacterium CG10_big_fil_rev_8_21_14_0_10_36_16]